MSKAEDKYIQDNKERIDNASNPEKKEESLRTFFKRRVEKGDFIIENGDYKFRKLTDDEQKDVDAANKKFGNKDGGKQKFKEGSKPDFLDLDKDGNKTEPMKQAAKQKVTAIKRIKKAKDGARTGVRGTGAAKRGFRKARLS